MAADSWAATSRYSKCTASSQNSLPAPDALVLSGGDRLANNGVHYPAPIGAAGAGQAAGVAVPDALVQKLAGATAEIEH